MATTTGICAAAQSEPELFRPGGGEFAQLQQQLTQRAAERASAAAFLSHATRCHFVSATNIARLDTALKWASALAIHELELEPELGEHDYESDQCTQWSELKSNSVAQWHENGVRLVVQLRSERRPSVGTSLWWCIGATQ